MNRIIDWSARPDRSQPFIPIVSPRNQGGTVEAVILSPQILGVFTHFDDDRTRPCFSLQRPTGEEVVECELCQRQAQRRWKGYVAVILARGGRQALLELTKGAMESCPALWVRDATFRGKRIRIRRVGQARNGRVVAELSDCLPANAADLPPPFDVEAALLRVWFGG